MNTRDHDFDTQLRAHWQAAGRHLAGRTRLQLSPILAAEQARARQGRHTQRRWFAGGAAFASLALAAMLVLSPTLRQHDDADAARIAEIAADAAATTTNTDSDNGLLTRSPDFYAWLGSDDVRILAME
ncbi:MAG: hypothetical protein Q4G62_05790 [Pseudomonadota bacterium]|nr:hypothetical protein [Pseudomonadota bacterium]